MNITKQELNNICKTLPIGYYIGRKLEVIVDETTDCSYFDPMKDEIHISVQQLNNTIDTIDNESDVRCMLYHEVSHAFLTPKNMNINFQRNVVEDERIETILANYYMGVDFKQFVKRVNHYNGEAPKNVDEAFYNLVRFRVGEQAWLDRLEYLLTSYMCLNTTSYSGCYEYDIDEFYKQFKAAYNDKQTQKQSNQTSNEDEEESSNNHQSTSSSQPDTERTEQQEQTETKQLDSDEPAKGTKNGLSKEEAAKIIDAIANKYHNEDINSKVDRILSKVNYRTKMNGSAINSYSGTFDYRAVVRDDYKYFTQKNRNGHVKATSKFHLNLFIDCSGSFHDSEDTANSLLKALTEFEKKDKNFDFDLVTCGIGQTIQDKASRKLRCRGGNWLKTSIFDQFRRLQKTDAVNYNIVMFDGDAFSSGPSSDAKNFAAFNTSNTTIISDYDNERLIVKYCENAKKIITRNYVEELIESVLRTLDVASR